MAGVGGNEGGDRGSEKGSRVRKWWGGGVEEREGRRAVEHQLKFIASHQNDSAWNNSEDGNKIMFEIHFISVKL